MSTDTPTTEAIAELLDRRPDLCERAAELMGSDATPEEGAACLLMMWADGYDLDDRGDLRENEWLERYVGPSVAAAQEVAS